MRVKVLATDVDGTITDSKKRISCSAIQFIRELEQTGVRVLLVSGNALIVLKTLKEYIGCTGALVAEGGGVVEYNGVIKLLGSREEPLKGLASLKEAFGDKIQEVWSGSYRYVDVALKRIVDRSLLQEGIGDFPRLKLLDSGYAFHIVEKEVDKGKGLKAALELMKTSHENVVAIGDSETDLELLKEAGYSVTFANAPPNVKANASYVSNVIGGEGFAETLKIMMLRMKRK